MGGYEAPYEAPDVVELGAVSELTQVSYTKIPGSGDFISTTEITEFSTNTVSNPVQQPYITS